MTLATPASTDAQIRLNGHKAGANRGGRPPRTQAAVAMLLKHRPQLWGRPSEIARELALVDSSFQGLSPKTVSQAISRLQRRFNGRLDPARLCVDEKHIAEIIRTQDGELVCSACGRSYGQDSEGASDSGQRAFVNRLWRSYDVKGLVYPRGATGTMISKAAVASATFGEGVEGRLTRKALGFLAEVCKGTRLPHESTNELASLVEQEAKRRAKYLKQASNEEARGAVVSALVTMVERDKVRAPVYLEMIRGASILFVDITKSTKSTKPSLFDEEERVSRVLEGEQN